MTQVNGIYQDETTKEIVAAMSKLDWKTDSDRVKVIHPDGSYETKSPINFEREYKPVDGTEK